MALQRSRKPKPKKPRQRKCRVCSAWFTPFNSFQRCCATAECALAWSRITQEKSFQKEQREAKVRLKSRSDWLRDAQTAFNAWIRHRDRNKPCVSCGRWHDGQWHAGHYRPAGNHSALRFDDANCHRQCNPCNTHKSGDLVNYRLTLLERIGEDELARLEKDHPPKQWTIDELRAITAEYRQRLKTPRNT